MKPRAILKLAPVFLLTLSGCADNPSVTARHSPFYRAVQHTSTIEARASDEDGIAFIVITITDGTMTDCSEFGGPPSVIPCRTGAVTFTHSCNFPAEPDETVCQYSQDFGNQAMITYWARAVDGTGDDSETAPITFAAGYPPVAGIARPIWWRRGESRAGKIDLGFFPDADYSGLYTSFTDDIETIIEGVFFNDQNFAEDYTLFRFVFNLWAAPFGADAEGCSRSFNSLVQPIRAVMDGQAIVHSSFFRDCAAIALGSSGSAYANAGDADWILVHESGHFLHGQGDEYCCDGGYGTAGSCRNVYSSQSDCQSYANANGLQSANCVQIQNATTQTGAWRIDDGSLETMEDRTDNSDWQDASNQCVQRRFGECISGSCY